MTDAEKAAAYDLLVSYLTAKDSEFVRAIVYDDQTQHFLAMRLEDIDPCYSLGDANNISEALSIAADTLANEGIESEEETEEE